MSQSGKIATEIESLEKERPNVVFTECYQLLRLGTVLTIKKTGAVCVSLCHRGGRMENINAWYLNTHMVYL
jgi:hypothetical protein